MFVTFVSDADLKGQDDSDQDEVNCNLRADPDYYTGPVGGSALISEQILNTMEAP